MLDLIIKTIKRLLHEVKDRSKSTRKGRSVDGSWSQARYMRPWSPGAVSPVFHGVFWLDLSPIVAPPNKDQIA